MCTTSDQPCSAATCTGVRPSLDGASAAEPPMRASSFTASTRFQAAAKYSGVQPSRSRAAGSQPCEVERHETRRAYNLGLRAYT